MKPSDKLAEARAEIQSIDAKIVSLLEKRLEVAGRAGEAKKEMDKPLKDPNQEEIHLEYLEFISELPPEMIEDVYEQIMTHSLESQK